MDSFANSLRRASSQLLPMGRYALLGITRVAEVFVCIIAIVLLLIIIALKALADFFFN